MTHNITMKLLCAKNQLRLSRLCTSIRREQTLAVSPQGPAPTKVKAAQSRDKETSSSKHQQQQHTLSLRTFTAHSNPPSPDQTCPLMAQ